MISEIDNLQGIGQVAVSGQEWSARSCDDKVRIPVGAVVNVMAINGVKLIVRPDEQMKKFESGGSEQIPEPMSVSQIEELEAEEMLSEGRLESSEEDREKSHENGNPEQ